METEIANAKRLFTLRQWSEMASARIESGLTVDAWCKQNGISIKTYYSLVGHNTYTF